MRPRVAVHKFSSCDGCQLAFLNLGEALLALAQRVEIVHFAEAGPVDEEAEVEIAFVEGSISTPAERERIVRVRERCRHLVTIGACATSGGLQALRNGADCAEWMAAVYPSPEWIETLATATPIADHVRVDLELWGCPVSSGQVVAALESLLLGAVPAQADESLCLECKRGGNPCRMVAAGEPCMGPVTRGGCGAICPAFGRGCYACYGPRERANGEGLARRFEGFGLLPEAIARRFLFINNNAPAFRGTGHRLLERGDE